MQGLEVLTSAPRQAAGNLCSGGDEIAETSGGGSRCTGLDLIQPGEQLLSVVSKAANSERTGEHWGIPPNPEDAWGWLWTRDLGAENSSSYNI